MIQDDLIRGLIAGFVGEAQEICEAITKGLLAIESAGAAGAPDHEAEVARGLHTLKGTAGSLGLSDLATMAHRLEDVFAPVRGSRKQMPADVFDALLGGLDLFLTQLRAYAEASTSPAHPERAGTPGTAEGQPATADESPAGVLPRGPETDDRTWRVSARDVASLMREIDRLRDVRLRLDARGKEVEQLLATLVERSLATKRSPRGEEAPTADARELLHLLARALKADAGDAADIVDTLEARVKAIGTQPVRALIDPLRRLVRDSCRATGKEAQLSLVGGEISIDRHVLQGLRESLLHLVRNAIDHGIESPAERDRAGKHREGSLVVRVEQHGNVLYVEFSDDGGGVDLDRVRAAVVRRGLVEPSDAQKLPARELHRWIWSSGFSTTTEVTESSGRGVGLDVVKRWVDGLGGHGEVHSVSGQGTRFVLTLPVEFGSSPTLVVRVAGQELGIPIAVIERILAAAPETIVAGPVETELAYDGRIVPLRDLGAMLALRLALVPSRGQPIVLVQSQGVRRALVVDEVAGDLDLVVRGIPQEAAELGAFQGASMTARGDLLLILRPGWLVQAEMSQGAAKTRRALVVDDSLTARALHRAMLEVAGYVVHTVSSGTQALEWLAHARYDVVVCDVAMSPMDGLAFTGTVRSRQELRDTPIVLVSARDDQGLRERGIATGADAFLSKSQCAAGRLLAEVSSAVERRRA